MQTLALIVIAFLLGWGATEMFPFPYSIAVLLLVSLAFGATWHELWAFFTGVRYIDLSSLSRQHLPQGWVVLEVTTWRNPATKEIVAAEAVIGSLRSKRQLTAEGKTIDEAVERAGQRARLLGETG